MNTENKLLEIKKLADAMYHAAKYLTTDASQLHKAMDEYHKFIIHECKEEPVSNSDWLTELQERLDNATPEQLEELWNKYNGVDEEEPVSEELEKAAIEICSKILKGETVVIDGYEYVVLSDAEECFKAGAQWEKEQNNKR